MSRHAAFANDPQVIDDEKNIAIHDEYRDGGSIAPTGTRGTDSEKSLHSEAGLVHKKETTKATRRLLLKLGQSIYDSRDGAHFQTFVSCHSPSCCTFPPI